MSRLFHPEQLRQDPGRHAEGAENADSTEKRQSGQANASNEVVFRLNALLRF
jgi:hypothetical protein